MAAPAEAAPSAPAGLSPRQRWTLTAVATSVMAISYIDRQALSILSPQVTDALKLTEKDYGDLTSMFSAAYLIGTPLGGLWLDRSGVRRGLVLAVLLWSVVAGMHAFVTGFAALLVLRFLLGLTEAPAFPGAAQTVTRAMTPAERPRGTGVLFTGSSVGAMITPPLAAYLSQRYGWQVAFLGTAAAGLCWVPLWWWATREPEVRALLAPQPPAATATEKTDFLTLLRVPQVQRGMAVVLASAPTASFVLLWGAKFLVRAEHVDKAAVGNFLWLPPVLYDVSSIFFGDQATRGRSPAVLMALSALLCMGCVALPLVDTPWSGTLALAVAHSGVGGLFAVATATALSAVPASAVARTGGMLAATQSLAYIVTSQLIGTSVEATHSFNHAAMALAAWVVPGVAYWIWRR